MTAHIFPQKRKRHPHRTELSFAPKMRSFVNATSRKRAKNYKQADTKTSPARHFRVAIPLAAVAKTVAIFVKKLRQQRVRRYHPQNRRQYFVTKILFSSRTSLSPSKHLRIRRLGSEQTAVGGAFNFRQEIFCWATVFPIRRSLH